MFGWLSGKKKAKSKLKLSKSAASVQENGQIQTKGSGHYKNWDAKRAATFERDGHRCQKCGATTRLQAHHKSYRPERLVTLCKSCHNKEHGFS